jgi:hypothetical protein
MIEAVPVTSYLRDQRYSQQPVGVTPELIFAAIAVIVVCAAATVIPLRAGLRRIEMMEW